MRVIHACALACAVLILLAEPATAEETKIDVRVHSKGAKFIGSSMGGVSVTIRDVETGEILDRGITKGSTGDTAKIMKEQHLHHAPVSTDDSAVYHAVIDIDEPRQIEIVARGPLAQPQAINTVRATQWVIPGKHITEGDAFLLELPGLVVDILEPAAHLRIPDRPESVEITANVTMMCGCPIEPDGIWDAADFEISAIIKFNGKTTGRMPLEFAGTASRFRVPLKVDSPGLYEVIVYGYQPATGNMGLDRTTFIVLE